MPEKDSWDVHKTPLNHIHKQLGARMVDFAGWEMPLLYTSILEEHHATRNGCTLFDISHMGRLTITGDGAGDLLEKTCTRRLSDAKVGRSYYSHMCNEAGGILDDVIVSRYESHWGVVCNASNREKIVAWLTHHAESFDATVEDATFATAMLAIQGPATLDLAAKVLPLPVSDLKRYGFSSGKYVGMAYTVFRSGYTGEDGLEVILPAGAAAMAWQFMVDGAKNVGAEVKPAGLGARDTLRLEAAMPLYGHELTDEIDSISAGLAWCVDLTKDFIGAEAMRGVAERGPQQKRVGLRLEGKRAAREGQNILDAGGNLVGSVTSGSFSPTLEAPIALGFVDPVVSEPGTDLRVDIRGTQAHARVVPLPFYRREKS